MTLEMYVECRAKYQLLSPLRCKADLGLLAIRAQISTMPHLGSSISVMSHERRGEGGTHPEDADGACAAEWRSVRLDHAEHAVQLPPKEEDDKELIGQLVTGKVSLG